MKIVVASLLGSLALAGTLPAVAAERSALAPGPTPSLQWVADEPSGDDRNSYIHQAQDDVKTWQQKLADWSKKAESEGKPIAEAAKHDLDQALHDAEVASDKLEASGGDTWKDAKVAFEKASHDLADAWHRNVDQK